MKITVAIAALSMISLGIASTADASNYRIKSIGAFTANGNITVTAAAVSLPCTTVLTGTTVGGAQITGATFSGLSCLALAGSNLPWRMRPYTAHAITIAGVEVSALVLGVCGPGNIKAGLNKGGVLSFSGDGLPGLVPCSVSGNLSTTPRLAIISR